MACHPALFVVRLVSPVASHSIPTSNRPKGPVLLAARCGFPCAGFRGLQANLVLGAAAPLERLPEAIPERPQVANPRST
jgi:hypothetical protein